MTLRDELAKAVDDHKISKAKAGYSGGKMNAYCSICDHFEPPDACEYVAGTINPQAWCRFFQNKRK